jgi:hypothetical protein
MNDENKAAPVPASSGGSAAASGMNFQAVFAARCAVLALAQDTTEFSDFCDHAVERVGTEQNFPVDDVTIWFEDHSRIFAQVKETLSLETKPASNFASVVEQIVRGFNSGDYCLEDLQPHDDLFLIVVGEGSSERVRKDLREALCRLASLPPSEQLLSAAQGQKSIEAAISTFVEHITRISKEQNIIADDATVRAILKRCRVSPTSQDDLRSRGRELLAYRILDDPRKAVVVFTFIEQFFHKAIQHRTSHSAVELRHLLLKYWTLNTEPSKGTTHVNGSAHAFTYLPGWTSDTRIEVYRGLFHSIEIRGSGNTATRILWLQLPTVPEAKRYPFEIVTKDFHADYSDDVSVIVAADSKTWSPAACYNHSAHDVYSVFSGKAWAALYPRESKLSRNLFNAIFAVGLVAYLASVIIIPIVTHRLESALLGGFLIIAAMLAILITTSKKRESQTSFPLIDARVNEALNMLKLQSSPVIPTSPN